MLSRKGLIACFLAAGTAVLGLPGAAAGSVVIGQTGGGLGGCTPDEAYLQKSILSGTSYIAAADGVITSWSAMSQAGPDQSVKLMVFRDDGSNHFSAVAKDSSVRTLSPVDGTLNTFNGVRIPITAGQRIGVYLPPGSNEGCESFTGNSGDSAGYSSPFGVGEPGTNVPFDYTGTDSGERVNASAVVEPDADHDVFGDETQDRCLGTPGPFNGCPNTADIDKVKQRGDKAVKVTLTVPGAGTLKVGSAGDPALASAARAKSLKAMTRTFGSTSAQQVVLTLKLTKSAVAKLTDAGKLKVKVEAVYTPPGGPAGSQTKKTKLRS